jgi:ribosomal protein L18
MKDGITKRDALLRGICYIPNLIYCLRFAPTNLDNSPLAKLIIDIALHGGVQLRNEVFWSLTVASTYDPAGSDIETALGSTSGSSSPSSMFQMFLNYQSTGGRWRRAENRYQCNMRDVLHRLIHQLGRQQMNGAIHAMRTSQRLVNELVQFSKDAAYAQTVIASNAASTTSASSTNLTGKNKQNKQQQLSASKQHGYFLSRKLQSRLVRAGVFSSSLSNTPSSVVNVISTSKPLLSVDEHARIQILSSATMPMVVSFNHQHQDKNDTTTVSTWSSSAPSSAVTKMLVKSEDVRTDLLMLNCVKIMNHIIEKELNEELGLLTYNVLPTGPSTGIVEFVQEAMTIAEIQTRYGSYAKFFDEQAKIQSEQTGALYSDVLRSIKIRFMKSLAGYSVATFLLGVGDRHTKNMMVRNDGTYFHIDFGYVLGEDPKPLQPPVRVTPMEEAALGTKNSALYVEFINLVCKIFNCVRHHLHLFTTMLLPLTMDSHLPLPYTLHVEEEDANEGNINSSGRSSSLGVSTRSSNSINSSSSSVSSRKAFAALRRRRAHSTSSNTTGINSSLLDMATARKGAVDMSSIRFTSKFLLEQMKDKFEPGMGDNEAEATMRQKVQRRHDGATAETMGRYASDQTREIIQNTGPKIKQQLRDLAGHLVDSTQTIGGIIGGGLLTAGGWVKDRMSTTVAHSEEEVNVVNDEWLKI